MNKLFQNTSFNLGFFCGLCLFALINFVVFVGSQHKFDTRQIKLSAGAYSAGFPFTFYTNVMGYPIYSYFDWVGLTADFMIAIGFSFALGLIFKFIWSEISSSRMK